MAKLYKKQFNIYLTEEQYNALSAISAKTGLPVSSIVRMSVSSYLGLTGGK